MRKVCNCILAAKFLLIDTNLDTQKPAGSLAKAYIDRDDLSYRKHEHVATILLR